MMTKLTRERGAAAIEFALILPLLLLILFGIIEFSILLYDKAMLTNASREGARLGIVFNVVRDPTDPNFGERYNFCRAEIAPRVRDYALNNLITFQTGATSTTPCVDFDQGVQYGNLCVATFCSADCTNFVENDPCPTNIIEGQCLRVSVQYEYTFLVLQGLAGVFPGITWPGSFRLRADTVMRME